MRIGTPAPQVAQLTRLHSFSCHLFQGADGLSLIDTGLPGSACGILRAVARLGTPLRRILITHGHSDHCGSLDRLVRQLPDVEVVASARTAKLMAGDRTLQPEDQGRPLRGGFSTCTTKPTSIVGPNDLVAEFRAVFTPGHAPGHVSYFHKGSGYLFTGDALHTAGGRLAVSGDLRLTFPFPYFTTWDRSLALESARALSALKPRALFPAHGPAVLGPAKALDQAITSAAEAFSRV